MTKQTKYGLLAPRVIQQRLPYKMDDMYDIHNHFIELTGKYPSQISIAGKYAYDDIINLIENEFEHIKDWQYSSNRYISSAFRILYKDTVIFIRPHTTYIADNDMMPIDIDRYKYKNENGVVVSPGIDLLYDPEIGIPDGVIEAFNKIKLSDNIGYNTISLICRDAHHHTLYTKDYPLLNESKFDFDLDLHYGEDFSKFHELSIKRIDNSDKGIILFHGKPGTGKSFYIRRLMRDLARNKKSILYLPNNMIDSLGTPEFNDFLIEFNEIQGSKADGIIIVIEDAERVLIKREINQYGSDGVSNILNSTDGILNDFFGIQVIATFNTDIKNIDEAILRKQRIISMREFRELEVAEAKKLVSHLNIDTIIDRPMTLADIYSIKQELEDKVLMKGLDKPKNKIGFNS